MIGGPLDSIIEDGTVETATPTVEVSPPEVVLPASVELEVVTSEPARPGSRRGWLDGEQVAATTHDQRDGNTQLSFSELQLND